MKNNSLLRVLTFAHGAYLFIGGLWPLVHMPSFEAVTGPKEEHWLVRSVAGLLVVIALVLLTQLFRHRFEISVIVVAMGASLTLGLVGMLTAGEGIIDPIYFLDASIHLSFVALWCVAIVKAWNSATTDRADPLNT